MMAVDHCCCCCCRFGHLGDTKGRRICLLVSVTMMAVPTVLIGCLPTFAQAGIAAPILLALLRAIQGLAMGGELSAVACAVVAAVCGYLCVKKCCWPCCESAAHIFHLLVPAWWQPSVVVLLAVLQAIQGCRCCCRRVWVCHGVHSMNSPAAV
jgi:hypothetical protein